ncbi:MAG: hypothetical protein V4619_03825 [Bacteroidota bacterium]
MKKETIPNQPEEMPVQPEHPEIKQPVDPPQTPIPEREVIEPPPDLPPTEGQPEVNG